MWLRNKKLVDWENIKQNLEHKVVEKKKHFDHK